MMVIMIGVWQLLGVVFHTKHLLINKYEITMTITIRLALYIPGLGFSHNQCTQAMYRSISWRCSSHKDALRVVDPLSSKDAAVVVDFYRFTNCHLEVIFEVNNIVTSAAIFYHRRRERCSSDHRRFFPEPGSAQYSSTPPLTTVWSNYQTLFNNFFEVPITKMVALSPNVQTDVKWYRELEMWFKGNWRSLKWYYSKAWVWYGFLFISYSNYGRTFSRLWKYSASSNGVTLKIGLGIVQDHWKMAPFE